MVRLTTAAVLVLAIGGCGKKSRDGDDRSDSSGSKSSGQSTPNRPREEITPSFSSPSIVSPVMVGETTGRPPSKEPSKEPAKSPPTVGIGRWAQVSEVAIRIDSVRVGYPEITSDDRKYDYPETLTIISYTVDNQSKVRKLEYHRPYSVFLTDEHGNEYRESEFPQRKIDGGVWEATIYPGGKPVKDAVCFQRPVAAAKILKFKIPGDGVGQKAKEGEKVEDFVFEIPASAWAPKK